MEIKKQTKKIAFCCPHHGALLGPVEYFSVNMRSKKLADVPVIYCKDCKKYYTPFTNLLALINPRYKGSQIAATQSRVENSFPKVEVRSPYFVDVEEENKKKERIRLEKAERYKQYAEGLREVYFNQVTLTNKPCFIKDQRCPQCRAVTRIEHVRITQSKKFLLANLKRCDQCNADYITPTQFHFLCAKAHEKIRGYYSTPFVSPIGISCRYQEESGRYLLIPKWALDFEKYDHHHLPPMRDELYDMTVEEYQWIKTYYQPEEFPVQLRQKSFLSEAGYSTSESEIRRHSILAKCVEKYGKHKVLNQLKSNMNLRLKQKDGNIRYEHALNIWRGDIAYVDKKL